jgi:hypothetical protein
MPPPPRRKLSFRKLVRKLGAAARPVQKTALAGLTQLCRDPSNLVAIAAAGPIPDVVLLLGPGYPDSVHQDAARALAHLSAHDDNKVTITAAGAIPPLDAVEINSAGAIPALKQLLRFTSDVDTKAYASRALVLLGDSDGETLAAFAASASGAAMLTAMGALRI